MECIDDYTHTSPNVMYFSRSIPTKEVEETMEPSNVFCECKELCNKASNCACLKHSGTFFSFKNITDLESYVLTKKKVNKPTYECNEQCSCASKLCGNKLVQAN